MKLRSSRITWENLWSSEDWLSVWIGIALLILGLTKGLDWIPKINTWNYLSEAIITASSHSVKVITLYGFMFFVIFIALYLVNTSIRSFTSYLRGYFKGFTIIFILSFIAIFLAKYRPINYYGLEYVLWALLLGLLISNIHRVPQWLTQVARTELFIKIGLVLLGAEILFSEILKAGTKGLIQAIIVVFIVWYFAFFISRKLGLDKEFSAVLATGVSICGVSAAIAAGGAIKADPKKISHVISLVLLTSIVLLVIMPPFARFIGLSATVAGAWIGGTIDTTPAVVAAGALHSEIAMKIASIVKMAQNTLIGIMAFILALYWALKERKRNEAPSLLEVWYRFPKFVIGFILASLLFSLIFTPILGYDYIKEVLSYTKELRKWFFSLAFVSIGLTTRLKELIEMGKGRPALAYAIAQSFNIIWTFIVVLLIWTYG